MSFVQHGKDLSKFITEHMHAMGHDILVEMRKFGFTKLQSKSFYIWADEEFHDAGFQISGPSLVASVDLINFDGIRVASKGSSQEIPITSTAKEIAETIIALQSPDLVVKRRLSKRL